MAESWTPKDDYSPSNHNHDDAYSAKSHNHDTTYSKLGHNHDERYYTETEVDAKLKTLKDEILAAGIDILPIGTIMWFKQSVTLSNKWQVYQPLIGRYPLGATSGLGNTVEAGLPPIPHHTHKVPNVQDQISGEGGYGETGDSNADTLEWFDDLKTGNEIYASALSTIYGNSDTVTPPSTKLIPYVKIA